MILEQKFTLAKISEIVGKNPATLRTHINRGYVTAWGPRSRGGNKPAGKHSRFGFFTLMEFALAYRLEAMGFQPSKAFEFAAHFSHQGGGGSAQGLPDRIPALPFHHNHGETIFAFAGECSCEDLWKPGKDYDTHGRLKNFLLTDSFTSVNVTSLFGQVCKQVGRGFEDYRVVLDQAYPEDAN